MTHTTQANQNGFRKKILIAEHAGFCHGVKRAVEQTLDARQSSEKPVYVLGQLIHNQQVIDQLTEKNIRTVAQLEEVPDGALCVVRTHGAPPEIIETAEDRGIEVSDATCPDVRLVQNKAIQLAEEGYTVVIVGKQDHPEIIGIQAHASRVPNARIVPINRPEEIAEKLKDLPKRRIGVVSQTTQMEESFFEMVKELSKISKELKVFNTICPATYFRQTAALDLSQKVDLMVVVGGKHSSNTTHLAEICREQGAETLHIETVEELKRECFPLIQAHTIGVTAGASTPDWIIQEVLDYLHSL